MKRLLLILALLCPIAYAQSPTVVQHTTGACNDTGSLITTCTSAPWNVTAGHAVFVLVGSSVNITYPNWTITASNGDLFIPYYTPVGASTCPGDGGARSMCAYLINASAGGTFTITATVSNAATPDAITIAAIELSGAADFAYGLATFPVWLFNASSITTAPLVTHATDFLNIAVALSSQGVSGFSSPGYTLQAFASSVYTIIPAGTFYDQIGILTSPETSPGTYSPTVSESGVGAMGMEGVALFSIHSITPPVGIAYPWQCSIFSGPGTSLQCFANLNFPTSGYGLMVEWWGHRDYNSGGSCIPTITDSAGDTFNNVLPVTMQTGQGTVYVFWVANSPGGSNFWVKADTGSCSQEQDIQIVATRGLAPLRPVINATYAISSNSAPVTSIATPPLPLPGGSTYIYLPYGNFGGGGTFTCPTGYVQKYQYPGRPNALQGVCDTTVAGGTSYTATVSSTVSTIDWTMAMVAMSSTNQTGVGVQQVTAGGNGVTIAGVINRQFPVPVVAGSGNHINVFASLGGQGCGSSTTPSVSDSLGNTFALIRGGTLTDTYALWDAPTTVSGTDTVQVACSSTDISFTTTSLVGIKSVGNSCGAQTLSDTSVSCSTTVPSANVYAEFWLGASGASGLVPPTYTGTSGTVFRNLSDSSHTHTLAYDFFTAGAGTLTSSGTEGSTTPQMQAAILTYIPLVTSTPQPVVNLITRVDNLEQYSREALGYE